MIDIRGSFQSDSKFMKHLEEMTMKSLEQTGEQVVVDLRLSQTMPMDTGHLQNASTYYEATPDGLRIASTTPYARRLYFHPEFNFRTDKNPHAGGRWFDPYFRDGAKGEFIPRVFAHFLEQNM